MELKLALANYPISIFQSFTEWENHTSSWINSAILENANFLVFPEYGSMELTSLFPSTMQQDLQLQIEEMQHLLDPYIAFFQHQAKTHDCIIVAPSFPVSIANKMVNRCFVFGPNGMGFQDKWNMTRFENEEWHISAPDERILTLFESKFGKFGIQICYDIEFPGATAVLAQNGAQLIIAPSCTETLRGATRVHVGARARAMEQQLFVAVSQTCNDALWSPAVDINYGYSAVYATPDKLFPETGIVYEGTHQQEGWDFVSIDLNLIEQIRKDGQVLNYKDFKISEKTPPISIVHQTI